MKIKFLPIIAFSLFISLSSFANGIDNNEKIKTAFAEKFADAKEVSWNSTSSYIKASFRLNDQVMFAYYSTDGALLGVSRNLLSSSLPIRLQTEIRKLSANGWIAELFEYASDDENSYFATIENADQKVFLKSAVNNGWSVVRREKKN